MIQINGLKKKYKDFTLDLTLDLPKGRVSGLVGKNGAGKSTTLKAILGLIQTDEGSVKVFGKDAFNLTSEEKQQLGVALSDSSFSGYLTVDAVKSILKNMYHSFDEEKFLDLSEKMRLGDPLLGPKLLRGIMIDLEMEIPPMPDKETLDFLTDSVNVERLGNHPVRLSKEDIRQIYIKAFTPVPACERQACLDIWNYYGR